MAKDVFKLDPEESFPHLNHAPSVEAVIHWQARAQKPLEEESLRSALVKRLPNYPSIHPVQHISMAAMMSDQSAPIVQHQKGWLGYRLTSDDNKHIIQFTRDGVAFSRLEPYPDWQRFTDAAIPVWRVFVDLAEPVEIQRLGVRFINQIRTATPESLAAILREPPTCPSNLPLSEFVYQSTFTVPEHPYGIRVIKVMQPSDPGLPRSSGLFLDCDVFTTKPISCEERVVGEALEKMHWLKNKIFFTLLTEEAIQSFS